MKEPVPIIRAVHNPGLSALFMNTSAALADLLLRRAFDWRLAPRTLTVLLGTGAFLLSACPCPMRNGTGTAADGGASPPVLAISQRTVMNNVG